MKKFTILLVICILILPSKAQEPQELPVFHRLMVFNEQNEILVAKIEYSEFWVTPGFYQSKDQSIKNGIDSLSATYGIVLKDVKLNGTFILNRQINGTKSTSLRHVYTAKINKMDAKLPAGIETIRWLSIDEAAQTINFPHINAMILQIAAHPDTLWGGTLLQYKEDDRWQSKILEDFYAL